MNSSRRSFLKGMLVTGGLMLTSVPALAKVIAKPTEKELLVDYAFNRAYRPDFYWFTADGIAGMLRDKFSGRRLTPDLKREIINELESMRPASLGLKDLNVTFEDSSVKVTIKQSFLNGIDAFNDQSVAVDLS